MKYLADERSRLMAEQNGWSLAFAQGCVEGETARRMGGKPTLHAVVGIDEYSLGFRAGYFERKSQDARSAGATGVMSRKVNVRAG